MISQDRACKNSIFFSLHGPALYGFNDVSAPQILGVYTYFVPEAHFTKEIPEFRFNGTVKEVESGDITIFHFILYPLEKFFRLFLKGDIDVIETLFSISDKQNESMIFTTPEVKIIMEKRSKLLGQNAILRLWQYAKWQKSRIKINPKDYKAKKAAVECAEYKYNAVAAVNTARVLTECHLLFRDGCLSYPLRNIDDLTDIKNHRWSLSRVSDYIEGLERKCCEKIKGKKILPGAEFKMLDEFYREIVGRGLPLSVWLETKNSGSFGEVGNA